MWGFWSHGVVYLAFLLLAFTLFKKCISLFSWSFWAPPAPLTINPLDPHMQVLRTKVKERSRAVFRPTINQLNQLAPTHAGVEDKDESEAELSSSMELCNRSP